MLRDNKEEILPLYNIIMIEGVRIDFEMRHQDTIFNTYRSHLQHRIRERCPELKERRKKFAIEWLSKIIKNSTEEINDSKDELSYNTRLEDLNVIHYHLWSQVEPTFLLQQALDISSIDIAVQSLLFQIVEESLDIWVEDTLFDARCEMLYDYVNLFILGSHAEISFFKNQIDMASCSFAEDINLFVRKALYHSPMLFAPLYKTFEAFSNQSQNAIIFIIEINKAWNENHNDILWRQSALLGLGLAYIALAGYTFSQLQQPNYLQVSNSQICFIKGTCFCILAFCLARQYKSQFPWKELQPLNVMQMALKTLFETVLEPKIFQEIYPNWGIKIGRIAHGLKSAFQFSSSRIAIEAPLKTMYCIFGDRLKDSFVHQNLLQLYQNYCNLFETAKSASEATCCKYHKILRVLVAADLRFCFGVLKETEHPEGNGNGLHYFEDAMEEYKSVKDHDGTILSAVLATNSWHSKNISPTLSVMNAFISKFKYLCELLSYCSKYKKSIYIKAIGEYFVITIGIPFDSSELNVNHINRCLSACSALGNNECFELKSAALFLNAIIKMEYNVGSDDDICQLFEEAIRNKKDEGDFEMCSCYLMKYGTYLLQKNKKEDAKAAFQHAVKQQKRAAEVGCEIEQCTGDYPFGNIDGSCIRLIALAYCKMEMSDYALQVFDSLKGSLLVCKHQKRQAIKSHSWNSFQETNKDMLKQVSKTLKSTIIVCCDCREPNIACGDDEHCILTWIITSECDIKFLQKNVKPVYINNCTVTSQNKVSEDSGIARGFLQPDTSSTTATDELLSLLIHIMDDIGKDESVQSVIIVPDGELMLHHDFMHTLFTTNQCKIAQRFSFSFAPSVALLSEFLETSMCAIIPNLCFVVNPLIHKFMKSYLNLRHSLADLGGAEREAIAIKDNLILKGVQSFVLCGPEATKSRLTSAIKGGINILHVAAHGIAHTTTIYGVVIAGGILLSPETDSEDAGDSILSIGEIKKYDMSSVELTVLNCCESGKGIVSSAQDGVLGLGRAFLFAGCRSVLVCSENVSDGPVTTILMNYFYDHYMKYRSAPAALRHAIVQTCDNVPGSTISTFCGYFVIGL